MLIFIVIDVPSARFMGNHHGIEMPLGGGIHRISSASRRLGDRRSDRIVIGARGDAGRVETGLDFAPRPEQAAGEAPRRRKVAERDGAEEAVERQTDERGRPGRVEHKGPVGRSREIQSRFALRHRTPHRSNGRRFTPVNGCSIVAGKPAPIGDYFFAPARRRGAKVRTELRTGSFFLTFSVKKISYDIDKIGAPEEIRTPDPQIRSLVLYPAELRARLTKVSLKRRAALGKGAFASARVIQRTACETG